MRNQALAGASNSALEKLHHHVDRVEQIGWDVKAAGCALRAIAGLARAGNTGESYDLGAVRSDDLADLLELVGGAIIGTEKKLQEAIQLGRSGE